MAPGVVATGARTVSDESVVSSLPFSSRPPSTYLRKVARVPEVAGRTTGTMGTSGPPTAFQLVIAPVEKIAIISLFCHCGHRVCRNWRDLRRGGGRARHDQAPRTNAHRGLR